MKLPQSIIESFLPEVRQCEISPLGNGLIHSTYLVTGEGAPHVFQELNDTVFKDPHQVMLNILRVQKALSRYPDPVLTFLARADGEGYLSKAKSSGRYWRCCQHIADTETHDIAPTPSHLKAAAEAFARFGQRLSSLDSSEFHPTIPNFHNTPHRYQAFLKAWQEAKPERRSQTEYEALKKLALSFKKLGLHGLIDGEVAQGITHNDTKLNNCLFSQDRAEVVCIVDLDTVMAGSWLLDFGDLCRTTVCPLPEDTENIDAIAIDEERFAAVVAGYSEVLRDTLTRPEQERMVYAAFLMTYELALRFFTDYLQNDIYFSTSNPQHNLHRTKAQIRLAECFLERRHSLEAIARN